MVIALVRTRALKRGQSIIYLLFDSHGEIRLLLLRSDQLRLARKGGLLLLVNLLLVQLVPGLDGLEITRHE